jgi:Conserved domain frequently associated with peptide methionine sulfoxide reductase
MHDYHKNPAAIGALRPEQYYVTQESGTERPFTGEYLDNHEPGIYVDVVSGEPLFASVDKFDSGPAGRASQTDRRRQHRRKVRLPPHHGAHRSALAPRRQPPRACFHRRTPVEGGLRYCINSAALRFIHRDNLDAEGYGHYLSLFETADSSAQQADSELTGPRR